MLRFVYTVLMYLIQPLVVLFMLGRSLKPQITVNALMNVMAFIVVRCHQKQMVLSSMRLLWARLLQQRH